MVDLRKLILNPLVKRYLIGVLVSMLFAAPSAYSQSKEQVYAGIIFHIMKYVEWPNQASLAKMSVGVLNDNQLTVALNKVAEGKRIVFKDIEIVKFDDLTAVKSTNVLFVPKKMTGDLGNIMKNVNTKEILVISEKKAQSQMGACINFIEQGGKMRFELYMAELGSTDLKMSEQLKRYAIIKS